MIPGDPSKEKEHDPLQHLLTSGAQAITITDSEGNIVFVNGISEDLFGYKGGELIGKKIEMLIPDRFRRKHYSHIVRFFKDGRTRTMGSGLDIWGLHKNGTEFPLDVGISQMEIDDKNYFVIFLAVIQYSKDVKEVLRESEARYRQLFEDDLTGNCIIDEQGYIIMCNPAFAELFGFSSPTVAERSNFFERFPSPLSKNEFLTQLHQRKKLALHEMPLHRTDGSLIYVMANIVGIFDEDGQLQRMKAYLLDITRRKEIEDQFLQAQKMESLGILAGSLAHDFSNFVSVIEGYTDIVLQGMSSDDPMRRYVEKIRQTNKQAALLIKQIQAFSRKQEAQPQKINVNASIHNIEEMITRLIGKKIRFRLELSPEVGKIRIDPVQIEQVIMNLAVNSRDAMIDGGDLTVATYQTTLSETQVLHSDVRPGHYVCIQVSDTGIGMDEATKSRIFEPFFTTKERDKGTGLGLSTVYGVIRQNHGHIDVSTAPGLGTIFRIYLPVVGKG